MIPIRNFQCLAFGHKAGKGLSRPGNVVFSAYRDQGPFPGADAAFARALALPLHSRLTDSELERVAEGVARFA